MIQPQTPRHEVPLYERLGGLLARYPDGPLPDDELDGILVGTGLGPHVIDVDDEDFELDDDDFGIDFADFDPCQEPPRVTAWRSAVLGAVTRTGDVRAISDELRRLDADEDRSDADIPDLASAALEPERARTLALHLLDTGITGLEIVVGLHLLAISPSEEDIDRVRSLPLLSSSLTAVAAMILQRIGDAVPHLHWMIERATPLRRQDLLFSLLETDFELLAAIPSAAPVGAAADLVLEIAQFEDVPTSIYSDRRLSAPILAAAENAHRMTGDPASIDRHIRLWDSLNFGRAALFSYGPGERERAAELFRSAIAAPEAQMTADAAPMRDPDRLWRIRQVRRAAHAQPETIVQGLAARTTVPAPSRDERVRTHLLVDGVPLAERHLAGGGPAEPETVFSAGGLQATIEPRTARIGIPSCGGHGCCEYLTVDIRHDPVAGRIEWATRFTDTSGPAVYWFEPDRYSAEIARAAADFSWEWPARRAARLLRERVEAEPDLFARWECEIAEIDALPSEPSQLRLSMYHPRAPAHDGSDEDWLQYTIYVEVPDALEMDDDAVRAVVDRTVLDLRARDPRSRETWSGGTPEMAKRLGYA